MIPANMKTSKHLIGDISYEKRFIVCYCGWRKKIPQDKLFESVWNEHRREVGEYGD